MIGKGSMVALKGHATFPMVVVAKGYSAGNRHRASAQASEATKAMIARREVPEREPIPLDVAHVVWLDRHGVPHTETYPLELLEELDG